MTTAWPLRRLTGSQTYELLFSDVIMLRGVNGLQLGRRGAHRRAPRLRR